MLRKYLFPSNVCLPVRSYRLTIRDHAGSPDRGGASATQRPDAAAAAGVAASEVSAVPPPQTSSPTFATKIKARMDTISRGHRRGRQNGGVRSDLERRWRVGLAVHSLGRSSSPLQHPWFRRLFSNELRGGCTAGCTRGRCSKSRHPTQRG